MPKSLTTSQHDRDIAGLKYIYPVMSRRAGGLSIGINFNPNNACNWRCIYCQVPDLKAGNAPEMDFSLLKTELRFFLDYVLNGDFYTQYNVVAEQQTIKDIAISGNGEPTSLKDFARAIQTIGDIANEFGVFSTSHFVLISNGSLLHQATVQAGLVALNHFHGELWFKLDSASEVGRKLINNTGQSQQKLLQNLAIASRLCQTKLQTCMLHYQQRVWTSAEKQAYLHLLSTFPEQHISIKEILLYSIARESYQAEAAELQKVDFIEMSAFADEIRALGYAVSVSA
jgi:wyosine [tRNA(Phe)-imidazoG37] synthetase (radical SAM superfamily)